MTMKLVIGQIRHETNTFSGTATTVEHFKRWGWNVGETIIEKFRGERTAIGGVIDRAEQLGVTIVPTFVTYTQPSGTITAYTFEALADELIEGIQKADDYDAVCLCLHGAGVAEGVEDMEGELLSRVRRVIGYDVPLVITLDLHANVTERMVEKCDAMYGDHYYPHIDAYDRGTKAVDTAVRMVQGTMRPTMHLVRLPLMIPMIATSFSPVKEINAVCREWEQRPGMIDCTLFHGFPFSDIARPGVAVVAISDDDEEIARQAAEHTAALVWDKKEEFFIRSFSPAEGVDVAMRSTAKNVVINEMSDNPGGGAPGDGTRLLAAMLEAGVTDACFAPMYDPETADQAHRAGPGAKIDVLLGGKTDDLHGDPIRAKAYVKCLSDGRFIRSSPVGRGREDRLGRSARLQVNGIDVIVCSARSQLFDEQFFFLHGIDVLRYKLIALKSSHHFRARFEQLFDEIISVDAPGLSTLNFTDFSFQNVEGDVYPLSRNKVERIDRDSS